MKRGREPLPYELLPSADTWVWRYLSLAKFLDILHSSSLYLARVDCLEDSFEGTFSDGSLAEFAVEWGTPYPDGLELLSRWVPCVSYVSCWCASSDESAALWSIYGGAGGLAIQSTVGGLQRAFPSVLDSKNDHIVNQAVRSVQYIDYRTQHPYLNDLMGPICYKRRAFAFERELRVIRQEIPSATAKDRPGGMAIKLGPAPERFGIRLPIIMSDVITGVYVAPGSPDWIHEGVRKLMDRFGLEAVPCHQSSLDELPAFGRLSV